MKLWRKFYRWMMRIEIAGLERELAKFKAHPIETEIGEAMMFASQLDAARRELSKAIQHETDLETRSKIRRIRL